MTQIWFDLGNSGPCKTKTNSWQNKVNVDQEDITLIYKIQVLLTHVLQLLDCNCKFKYEVWNLKLFGVKWKYLVKDLESSQE